MRIRDLIKPAPLAFVWIKDGSKDVWHIEVPPDLWGSITGLGDGTCTYTVCNRATERCPDTETAKRRVEGWIQSIVSERIKDAIRKIEAHCIPALCISDDTPE